MDSKFQQNLKKLSTKHTQKQIALKTGFSQSSINNYLAGTSEPSIQFLIELKNSFGICIDDFLFTDISVDVKNNNSNKFLGDYFIYYYNNDAYKGEIHNSLKNTLTFGLLSIYKAGEFDGDVKVKLTPSYDRWEVVKAMRACKNRTSVAELEQIHEALGSVYNGSFDKNDQNVFIKVSNAASGDNCFIILNNPTTLNDNYWGGVGTVNSVARGREHNPCVQYVILSKKILNYPDGEICNYLKLDDYKISLDDALKEITELFKRFYMQNNEISMELTEEQKQAIIKNNIEYHFKSALEANIFRFAKVSNKEDDFVYKLISEGEDV